jgi:hypothetical protein
VKWLRRSRIASPIAVLALLLGPARVAAPSSAPDALPPAAPGPAPPTLIVVVGAPGAPEYAGRFRTTALAWQQAGSRAHAAVTTIGLDPGTGSADRDRLEIALRDNAGAGSGPLWLVFIGHGTHDGRLARFNLRGRDVSAAELAAWCKPIAPPLVFINGASASGPFVTALAGPGRIVVTATKSGAETSATRFGDRFAEAIGSPRADLDRDGGVSVLEAFLLASKEVEASFAAEGLLASEHALLEDNGDGLGTSAGFFHGLAASEPAAGGAPRDGARAREISLVPAPAEAALPPKLRERRDQLEVSLATLRAQRPKLGDAVYYDRLERLLLSLARLYQQAGRLE